MEIKLIEKENYTVLKLRGSLDIYTSLDLKTSFEAVKLENCNLIFDLSFVDYVDSSGIGTLIKMVNKVQDANGNFYITGLKTMIAKIFKVAGLMSYFKILTEEEYKSRFPVD